MPQTDVLTWVGTSGRVEMNFRSGPPVSELVKAVFESRRIPGVRRVLFLPRASRPNARAPKVFVILETHDIDRDREIVDLMIQFDHVDYDLVPAESAGMVPNDTITLV